MSAPKFKTKEELADQLNVILAENRGLIKDSYLDEISDAVNQLYDDEADADYEDSYEDSSC